MRHTDPRLTETTYMDEALLPIASELTKVPPIPEGDEATAEAIPLRATGTGPQQASANIQQIREQEAQPAGIWPSLSTLGWTCPERLAENPTLSGRDRVPAK